MSSIPPHAGASDDNGRDLPVAPNDYDVLVIPIPKNVGEASAEGIGVWLKTRHDAIDDVVSMPPDSVCSSVHLLVTSKGNGFSKVQSDEINADAKHSFGNA